TSGPTYDSHESGARARAPRFLGGDLVVAAADELDQADAVTERIGEHGDLAPVVALDRAFQPRAGVARAIHRAVDFAHDDIQVDRGPVPRVRAQMAAGRRGNRAVGLGQQIDGRGRAEQLDRIGTETPPDRQPEGLAVELDAFVQIVNVDVDEQRHA